MSENIHPLAGKKPAPKDLITEEEIKRRYFSSAAGLEPIKNGTSGHRGKTGTGFSSFHVAALTQALVDIRRERGTFGPIKSTGKDAGFKNISLGPIIIGKDVRFSSDYALRTAVEVFAGNGMKVIFQKGERSTPTPVISHQIIEANKRGENVEGVVITASHNPPEDAGYKSNGRDGGPNTETAAIDKLANHYLNNPAGIKRIDFESSLCKEMIVEKDLLLSYVKDLSCVVDFDYIKGTKFGATPLGGSAHGYYEKVNEIYGTSIEVVVGAPDPASSNRTYDWDGKLRGDPSSTYAMKAIEGLRDQLGVPFIGANDNDADRFGGEDSSGVLNPNHVLCVVFDYLVKTRGFNKSMGLGRTIGSTHMLDLIAANYDRPVHEVNVGFKWYVEGLLNQKYVLAGEESSGLSLPRRDGSLWVTEKDGIAAVLLLMEIVGKTQKDIGSYYKELENKYGPHQYERVDVPATKEKKSRLQYLASNPEETKAALINKKIAGKSIESFVIGDGVKVVLADGIWVLKRASGTEDIIKDYREQRGDNLDAARKASEEIDHILKLA